MVPNSQSIFSRPSFTLFLSVQMFANFCEATKKNKNGKKKQKQKGVHIVLCSHTNILYIQSSSANRSNQLTPFLTFHRAACLIAVTIQIHSFHRSKGLRLTPQQKKKPHTTKPYYASRWKQILENGSEQFYAYEMFSFPPKEFKGH